MKCRIRKCKTLLKRDTNKYFKNIIIRINLAFCINVWLMYLFTLKNKTQIMRLLRRLRTRRSSRRVLMSFWPRNNRNDNDKNDQQQNTADNHIHLHILPPHLLPDSVCASTELHWWRLQIFGTILERVEMFTAFHNFLDVIVHNSHDLVHLALDFFGARWILWRTHFCFRFKLLCSNVVTLNVFLFFL